MFANADFGGAKTIRLVSSVEAAGDVCRGYVRHHFSVVSHLKIPVALIHTVQSPSNGD